MLIVTNWELLFLDVMVIMLMFVILWGGIGIRFYFFFFSKLSKKNKKVLRKKRFFFVYPHYIFIGFAVQDYQGGIQEYIYSNKKGEPYWGPPFFLIGYYVLFNLSKV
jgi:hypothetical protein